MSETAAATRARRRVRAHVAGTVQGVGFRPFVYRLASELGLGGWVLNDERGVVLEVEGAPEAVEALLTRLRAEAPPLAAIEEVRVEPAAPDGRARVPDPRVRARRPAGGAGLARLRHLRRVPGRGLRPRRPPAPLPVHQLHQLRPALLDRQRRSLRPAADDDGRVRDVRALPGRVRGPARPPLPRPAQRLPGLRPARPAGRRRRRRARRARRPRRGRGRGRDAALRHGRSRSRASAATTSPASPPTRRRWPRCGRASTARRSRSR